MRKTVSKINVNSTRVTPVQPDLFEGTNFEENYLRRTYKLVTSNPLIALTELVANAWDAGATEVRIKIPVEVGGTIEISDNGVGLSESEFHKRWQTLGYDRLSHQSRKVEFPDKRESGRIAFGRNGLGRHAMMCFADDYTLVAKKDRAKITFIINSQAKNPINVVKFEKETVNSDEHGLLLRTKLRYNLPNAEEVLNMLSRRFIADPEFNIYVNDKKIEATELVQQGTLIKVSGSISIHISPIDVEATRKCVYQGIAFWQNNRLIGEPSWYLGNKLIVDGRTAIARRYVFIVKTEDLADHILPEWTGFIDDDEVKSVYDEVEKFVCAFLSSKGKESLLEVQKEVRQHIGEKNGNLSKSAELDVDETVKEIISKKPTISKDTLELIAETTVHISQMRTGKELLAKIATLSEEDVEGLNHILANWNVRDACRVLDEIDRRLSVIEAIKKLSNDKNVDELHVLHPLIADSRWVFGPEFESPEYVFNRQLQTAAKVLFGLEDAYFAEPNKRPDLIVNAEYRETCALTGLEDFSSGMVRMRKILLVELKRGGFRITEMERNQALHYAEVLYDTDAVDKNTESVTYVVGASVDKEISRETVVRPGHLLRVATFDQIVDTANSRLLRLRERLSSRYDEKTGMDLFNQVFPEGYEKARQDIVT